MKYRAVSGTLRQKPCMHRTMGVPSDEREKSKIYLIYTEESAKFSDFLIFCQILHVFWAKNRSLKDSIGIGLILTRHRTSEVSFGITNPYLERCLRVSRCEGVYKDET